MYNITFQQIEAFLIVSKHLNLSKAAEAMFITQSALSKTLQRFEEGVDMQLFVRSNKGLTLTNEGKYLYSTLESLYSNMNKTIKAARNISGEYVKHSQDCRTELVRRAGISTGSKSCPAVSEQIPDVVMLETLCDFKELRQAIEFDEADLVFAQDFSLTGISDIQYKRISRFRLYLAMTIDHPLAQSEFVFNMNTLEALSQEVFYTVPIPKEPLVLSNTLDKCRGIGFFTQKGRVCVKLPDACALYPEG
jgi:DNA-binding transcriptional LysR family regulator